MFCGKCGMLVDDDANVCSNCGNVLKENANTNNNPNYNPNGNPNYNQNYNPNYNPNNNPNNNINFSKYIDLIKSKISKKTVIIAGVAIIVVAVPIIYFSMPSTKIIGYIKDGDYEEAMDLYDDNYKRGKGDFFLNNGLIGIAKKCEQDFINSKIKADDAFDLINGIRNMEVDDIEDELDEIYSSISSLSYDRRLIEEAEEYFSDGNYLMAISSYNSLSKESPLYEGVAAKIEEAKGKYKSEVLAEVDSYIEKDSFRDLTSYVSSNISDLDDSELTSEIMNKYYSYLETKTNKFLSDDLYSDAVSNLYYAQDFFSDDKKIDEMLDNIETNYVNSSLKKAEEAFNNGNYEVAASTVQVAMEQVEENEQLSNKYNEYKAYLPAYINDLDYFNKYGDIYTNRSFDRVADNTGKEYGRAYCVDGWRDAFSAEYLVNGNYTNFEGVCGVAYEERTAEDTKFFEVYGDGVLLYTSPTFTAGSLPTSFNINISNVKILKILYPDTSGSNKIATIFDGKIYNKNNTNKSENTTEATS